MRTMLEGVWLFVGVVLLTIILVATFGGGYWVKINGVSYVIKLGK